MSRRKRKEVYTIPLASRARWVGIIAGVVALGVVVVAIASNFVVDGKFVVRGASVTIEGAPIGTSILIDSVLRGQVSSERPITIRRVTRGKHTLIATSAGAWPWTKTLNVMPGDEIHLTPLFIKQESDATLYDTIPEGINFNNTNAQVGNLQFYVEDTDVYMQNNTSGTPLLVFSAEQTVSSLAVYPGRSDTLILASGETVFALDIEQSDTRNFLPIYTGTAPTFALDAEHATIYIKDGGQLVALAL